MIGMWNEKAWGFRADGGENDHPRVMLRPNASQANGTSRLQVQKGFTTTRMTMIAVATPGISFISRSALPLAGRLPAASLRP